MVMLMWWWVGLKAVVVMLGCGAQSPSQLGHNILIMIIKLIWPFPVRSISSPPVASGWWSISFLFVCTAQVGSCNCIDWEIHAMCANLQEASFYYILSALRFTVRLCEHALAFLMISCDLRHILDGILPFLLAGEFSFYRWLLIAFCVCVCVSIPMLIQLQIDEAN